MERGSFWVLVTALVLPPIPHTHPHAGLDLVPPAVWVPVTVMDVCSVPPKVDHPTVIHQLVT